MMRGMLLIDLNISEVKRQGCCLPVGIQSIHNTKELFDDPLLLKTVKW